MDSVAPLLQYGAVPPLRSNLNFELMSAFGDAGLQHP